MSPGRLLSRSLMCPTCRGLGPLPRLPCAALLGLWLLSSASFLPPPPLPLPPFQPPLPAAPLGMQEREVAVPVGTAGQLASPAPPGCFLLPVSPDLEMQAGSYERDTSRALPSPGQEGRKHGQSRDGTFFL